LKDGLGYDAPMWEMMRAGGPLMWPIILCSVIALAITLERVWSLQRSHVVPADALPQASRLLSAETIDDRALESLRASSPLGRVLATVVTDRELARDERIARIQEVGRHEAHALERYLNTLGTVASVAPLLGLLGTVTGIIRAFSVLESGVVTQPDVLSGGISEALVTTAAGLLVAIPALIAHRSLRGHIDSLVIEMEKQALALLVVRGARR
jgi:biopolymer transport protein ExbB